jgi:hypothetical protein
MLRELEGEERWRDAMQKKGKFAVRSELHRRSGGPDDPVYDIVHTPPFPTREYVARWCAEEDNRLFAFSKQTVVTIFVALILLIGIYRSIKSLSTGPVPQLTAASRMSAGSNRTSASSNASFAATSSGQSSASQLSAGQFSTDVLAGQSTAGQAEALPPSPASATSPSGTGTSGSTTPSYCQYIKYATTRCPPQSPGQSPRQPPGQ